MDPTSKPAEEQASKLAIAATKAIAIELLKIVPIIGPFISVGTKAILDKIEKMDPGVDALTSKAVLTWMTNLSPDAYEKLVLEAIDLEPLVKDNAQRASIIKILLRSKPDLVSLVEALKDQEDKASSSYHDVAILNQLLSAENRQPSPDERRLILRLCINTNNWTGALKEIDQIMMAHSGDASLYELDLLVARRHYWTPWAMGGGVAIGFLLVYLSAIVPLIVGATPSIPVMQIALFTALPSWLFLEWLFPRMAWGARRWAKRFILGAAVCATLLALMGAIFASLSRGS
jgi:hypothetical protein